MLLGMKTSHRPKTNDTLVTNLRALMKATKMTKQVLHQKSRVSERMIGYILAHERKPTVEIAEALASAFGLTGWQLIMPDLPIEIAKSGKLDELIHNYSLSSESGREYINRVAEQESKYSAKK
jgi:transcriptional regulator with XRE-family HTH domain